MEKLNQLRMQLNTLVTHSEKGLICFLSSTGEPHTAISQTDTDKQERLIVSGSEPRQAIFSNPNVEVTLKHIQAL